MEEEIARITIDYDEISMVAYNMVDGLNIALEKYGFLMEIEDESHDGYDILVVKRITN